MSPSLPVVKIDRLVSGRGASGRRPQRCHGYPAPDTARPWPADLWPRPFSSPTRLTAGQPFRQCLAPGSSIWANHLRTARLGVVVVDKLAVRAGQVGDGLGVLGTERDAAAQHEGRRAEQSLGVTSRNVVGKRAVEVDAAGDLAVDDAGGGGAVGSLLRDDLHNDGIPRAGRIVRQGLLDHLAQAASAQS